MPLHHSLLTRRQALAAGGLTCAAAFTGQAQAPATDLIRSISHEVIWDNLDGHTQSWFHPRGCMLPASPSPIALMTLQVITGSDYFGPVHWTESHDFGRTWSDPQPIPALGRIPVQGHDGLQEGVCDVVPEYHPATRTVLAMGHNVYYRGDRFSRGDQLARYPVYAVRRADGSWSERRKLEWDDPRGANIYSNGCGQRVVLPDGDILMSFTFGPGPDARSVAGVRCKFDGERLTIREVGPPLTSTVNRGLLEPSVTRYRDKFYLTIRAEDDRGYVSISDDGLNWRLQQAWAFDDGEPLVTSTTQQHWLTHSDGLFLVYTRKDATNVTVPRWRAPLYVAHVDPDRLCLRRESERIVFPLLGDGVKGGDRVPMMGNFHITNASPDESWVTVGSWIPKQNANGQTLLGRIRWSRPNRLV
jgi:hypothetical protein